MPRITGLKQFIVSRRVIQADLAEEAHVSETKVSRIVNGRVRPTDYELENIAAALGIPRDELEALVRSRRVPAVVTQH